MDTLFCNATVVTMDGDSPVLRDAYLGVSGRKVAYLSQDKPVQQAARVVDCRGKVIMPGLYNCHAHAGMVVFKGYANDLNLEDWLFNHIFPAEQKWTAAHVRVATQLAMAEMICMGTISFSDMYCHMDAVAEAAYDAGMLANISNGIITFDDDYDFTADHVYAQMQRAMQRFHGAGDGRIQIDASIHGVYTSHPRAWAQVLDFAQRNSMRMHVHLSETKTEHEGAISKFGGTPAAVFAENGIFDVPCLAAHGVWVSDADIEILASKGVNIAHNPVSNLKLASGIAPVIKMQKSGINVCIGTDGMSSNNSHDMFEELKIASILQKNHTCDPTALPAAQALRMATVHGAIAQGRDAESGILRENMDADLIIVDFDTPHNAISHDPVLSLAYSTSGRDVFLTMVRGKILYENGNFLTLDIEKIKHEARKIATEMIG
jgi:5-methylthioadenosine/S-adenosylhomocysteine deaminase